MMIYILSTINFLFKEPSLYELVFPIKNPYLFKNFYFTFSLNSEESSTLDIGLFYKQNGVLDDSFYMEQKQVFGKRGGINSIGVGYKIGNLQFNFKYYLNELFYIETSDNYQIKRWDMVFGKIRDTLYPSDIKNLDRSIIVEYDFDSLYRNLNLNSSGKFSIYANPIVFELGYKNFLIGSEMRFLYQLGNSIEYSARNYYLSYTPKVKILNYNNYLWQAYLRAVANMPDPFKIKRTFQLEKQNHFSFYFAYFNNNTLFKVGYSPSLKINLETLDDISYIVFVSNNIDSVKLNPGSNYLYVIKEGDTFKILNFSEVYLFFSYKDTSFKNVSYVYYEIPSSLIFELYYSFKLKNFNFTIFSGQKSLKRLYLGLSNTHKLYGKVISNYGYVFNKNAFFDYQTFFFNALVPTGRFLFSFGGKLDFHNKFQHFILNNLLKDYLNFYKSSSLPSIGFNFQVSYIR
ncbi:MAG: hypothetical protein RMJ38_04530 [candidate division WOR-3 bacterium]|nr:hypothetical protein [candidate division WOR-3 bacterium]MDW8150687.1 hypothetical protein [candidate division WOR-3 bacterium]